MLWDAESGQRLATLTGHQSDVEAVAFFARGTRIVSPGQDKSIKVWGIDGNEILTAVGFGEKDHVVYTPEGCYSGSQEIENRVSVFLDNRSRSASRSSPGCSFPRDLASCLRADR
jgi:WD40 repeat protein